VTPLRGWRSSQIERTGALEEIGCAEDGVAELEGGSLRQEALDDQHESEKGEKNGARSAVAGLGIPWRWS
jgi:hypothetical protein